MIGDSMEVALLFCCNYGFLHRCCCCCKSVFVCASHNNLFPHLFLLFIYLLVQETKIDCVRVATKGRTRSVCVNRDVYDMYFLTSLAFEFWELTELTCFFFLSK